MTKPKTGAERQRARRAKGRQIAVVLTDEKAIASLESLTAEHGGVKAAVTHALHAAASKASKSPH